LVIVNEDGDFIPRSFKSLVINKEHLLKINNTKSIQADGSYILQGGDTNLRQDLMRGKQCYLKLIYTEENYNKWLNNTVNIGFYSFDSETEFDNMKNYFNQISK
jgi:hypothetical protein